MYSKYLRQTENLILMRLKKSKARNEELGLKAVKELDRQGIQVAFHQLDIDDLKSINRFAEYIKNKYRKSFFAKIIQIMTCNFYFHVCK